ncbi:MAG: LPS export ABC transporter periplasmic protein LptC [Spirochaetia bacterium]|nr:LPS export ABC transporter periplasmic protein LptC [Spirochaetia bacterium]
MGRLIRTISLLALPALLSLTACKDDAFVLVKERTREMDANIRLRDFKRTSLFPSGKKEWTLTAGEAYIYRKDQEQKRTVAYDFKFEQFDLTGRTVGILTGERGDIDYDKHAVEITGKVSYLEPGKSVMNGEKMRMDLETKILTSDDLVVITEGDTVTRCRRGVIADREHGRQTCRSPAIVRASTGGKSENFDDVFH